MVRSMDARAHGATLPDRASAARLSRTPRRSPRSSARARRFPAARLRGRSAASLKRVAGQGRRRARPFCCREAIARRAFQGASRLTTSAISSACSYRWRWCMTFAAGSSPWSRSAASPASSPSRARKIPPRRSTVWTLPDLPRRHRQRTRTFDAQGLASARSRNVSSKAYRQGGGDAEPAARLYRLMAATPTCTDMRIAGCSASWKDSSAIGARYERARVPTSSASRSASWRAIGRRPPSSHAVVRAASRCSTTSHEALLLGLRGSDDARRFDDATNITTTSGHMIWIGDRTRQGSTMRPCGTSAAGVIKNPLRPEMRSLARSRRPASASSTRSIPDNEPGRLTLIARFGSDKSRRARCLKLLANRSSAEGRSVVWSC